MPFPAEHHRYDLAQRNLRRFFGFSVLDHLSGSVVGLFSTIYLYVTAGFSLVQIALFSSFYSLAYVFLAPLGAKFAAHYGVRASLLVSAPFYLILMGGYYILQFQPQWLFGVAILSALFAMFYWPAYHIDLAHALRRGHEGREVGLLFAILTLVGVGGTALGGYLYDFHGAGAMFLAASMFTVLALIPLLITRDVHEPFALSYRDLLAYSCSPGYWAKNIVWAAHSIQLGVLVSFWPIYVYLVLTNIWEVAWLTSLTTLVTMVVMVFFGRLADQWDRWRTLRLSALANLLAWLAALFVYRPVGVALADALGRSASGAVQVSMQTILYKRAKHQDQVSFLMRRELFHHAGKIIAYLVLAGLLFWLGESFFFIALVMAALACLGYFLIY